MTLAQGHLHMKLILSVTTGLFFSQILNVSLQEKGNEIQYNADQLTKMAAMLIYGKNTL